MTFPWRRRKKRLEKRSRLHGTNLTSEQLQSMTAERLFRISFWRKKQKKTILWRRSWNKLKNTLLQLKWELKRLLSLSSLLFLKRFDDNNQAFQKNGESANKLCQAGSSTQKFKDWDFSSWSRSWLRRRLLSWIISSKQLQRRTLSVLWMSVQSNCGFSSSKNGKKQARSIWMLLVDSLSISVRERVSSFNRQMKNLWRNQRRHKRCNCLKLHLFYTYQIWPFSISILCNLFKSALQQAQHDFDWCDEQSEVENHIGCVRKVFVNVCLLEMFDDLPCVELHLKSARTWSFRFSENFHRQGHDSMISTRPTRSWSFSTVRHCVSHIVRTLLMSWIIKELNMTSSQSKSWRTGPNSNGNFSCDHCEQLVLESNRTSLLRQIRDQSVINGWSVSLWTETSEKARIPMIMISFLRVCGIMKFLCGHNRNIINSCKHFLTKSVAPFSKVTGMSLTVNSSLNFVLTFMLWRLSCRWIESKSE